MYVDELSLKELKDLGWDGDFSSLEAFKQRIKLALALGWDRYEMSLEEFEEIEEHGDEPSEEIRRKRAEENGWDEEEMDLEEFEDLFM